MDVCALGGPFVAARTLVQLCYAWPACVHHTARKSKVCVPRLGQRGAERLQEAKDGPLRSTEGGIQKQKEMRTQPSSEIP